MKRALRRAVLACTIALLFAVAAGAQTVPTAELTPLNGADGVHPGDTAHLALQITLPAGFHTNSNKPHDPSLIRITLTVDPAPGVTPEEIVFPEAADLKVDKALSEQPLSVFTGTFVVGVALKVAPTAAPGDVTDRGEAALPGVRREAVLPAEDAARRVDAAHRAAWGQRRQGVRAEQEYFRPHRVRAW